MATLSPPTFLKQESSLRFLEPERNLYSQDDDSLSSYFQDADGNAYHSYSLAWRYLGMYVDCDLDGYASQSNDDSGDGRRRMSSNDDQACSRKVLWAAYRDPRYRGGSIGEYQFYDWVTGEWDDSTCETKRCVKMNCHEPKTHFQLIGVFKETDGLYDWAEQLFKHQGYCVWDGDKGDDSNSADGDSSDAYEFMQTEYGYWADYFGCTELSLEDGNGNTLYVDAQPQAEGNFTYGVYTDEACTQLSSLTWGDYIIMWYQNYYYYYNNGNNGDYTDEVKKHEDAVVAYNELMNDFKVCQPCRAYNKVPTYGDGSGDNDDDDNYEDGEGAAEQWGYNCYDDAGYQNCNQCHKFLSKTDLEIATAEDLARASSQGTILSIKVDGVHYGSGGFNSPADPRLVYFYIGFATFVVTFLLVRYHSCVWYCLVRICDGMRRFFAFVRRQCCFSEGVREALIEKEAKLWQLEEELARKRTELQEQENEMYFMQAQIDNDRRLTKEKEKRQQQQQQVAAKKSAKKSSLTIQEDIAFEPLPTESPPPSPDRSQVSPTASPKRTRSKPTPESSVKLARSSSTPAGKSNKKTPKTSPFRWRQSPSKRRTDSSLSSPPRTRRTQSSISSGGNSVSTSGSAVPNLSPADDKELC